MPDGLIRPRATITRAEVATIFFRLLEDDFRTANWSQQNPFSDVTIDMWFNNAISTMTNIGVLHGLPDGTFSPNRAITRAEFVAIAARFVGEKEIDTSAPAFDDIRGHWAEQYIHVLAALGWVQGDGSANFRPDDYMERAEVAAAIGRMLDRRLGTIENTRGATGQIRRWPDNADENAWYYLYIQEATHSTEFYRNGEFVAWLRVLEHLDWSVLERPDSEPGHLTRLLDAW
jgi:hypothetical protein